ncbi:2Fe-2S iron-sulfur cluster-binding protein [Undibacterium sp. RuRC25W]|uniref:2Fe-2S iron-sulfur cluster-binding protein n=1 Tax=Undibacterium sp. RuRC25W TaxID=3413047 RepID=UPI003BF08261
MEQNVQDGSVTILLQEWQYPVLHGQSILEASLLAGIRLPNSCRNGTCRACMCKLVDGEIRYRIDWPGLSAEEKAECWILPCVAEAKGAIVIDAPFAAQVKTEG